MTSLVLCRLIAAFPTLDREQLHRELSAVKRRRTWPGPDAREPALRARLLDALHVAPGQVPAAARDWLLSLPQDEARALVADLLAILAIYLTRMPAAARSLAVEEWGC